MDDPLLQQLLTADPEVPTAEAVSAWWPRHQALAARWRHPIERAIAGGFDADRVAWAFASGYQTALRQLIPSLPETLVCALCVTEAGGTAPRAMQTCLYDDGHGGLKLSGAKRWTTLGPEGSLLLVAARDSRHPGERPAIRLIRVSARAPGVLVREMPPTGFVPEVPHAQVSFDHVGIDGAALFAGDGYADYVKPFRSVEDLHVQAAVLAYLVRESRRLDWPQDWTERAIALLLAFRSLADRDPAASTTHLALAGALRAGAQLATEADVLWSSVATTPPALRWQRDRRLMDIAAQPREARRALAWTRLAAVGRSTTG